MGAPCGHSCGHLWPRRCDVSVLDDRSQLLLHMFLQGSAWMCIRV